MARGPLLAKYSCSWQPHHHLSFHHHHPSTPGDDDTQPIHRRWRWQPAPPVDATARTTAIANDHLQSPTATTHCRPQQPPTVETPPPPLKMTPRAHVTQPRWVKATHPPFLPRWAPNGQDTPATSLTVMSASKPKQWWRQWRRWRISDDDHNTMTTTTTTTTMTTTTMTTTTTRWPQPQPWHINDDHNHDTPTTTTTTCQWPQWPRHTNHDHNTSTTTTRRWRHAHDDDASMMMTTTC